MTERHEPETVDAVLNALGNVQRRYALYYLRDRGEVQMEELATALTGWFAVLDDDGTAGPGDYDRAMTSLHHRDLPVLTDAGLLSVDTDAGTVTAELSTFADALLDRVFEHERVPEAHASAPESETHDVSSPENGKR